MLKRKNCLHHLLQAYTISFFVQGNVKESKNVTKISENSYYWQRKSLYLLNNLSNFNAIFRIGVTYDNIKSHTNLGFRSLFGRYIYGKSHFRVLARLLLKFYYYISNQKATLYWSLLCLQVLRIRVAAAENYILKEGFLLLKANVTEKIFSYFHIQNWLVSLLIILSEWNARAYSFFLYWLPQCALYFTRAVKIKLNCFMSMSNILEKYFILSSRLLVARYNALYHRKTTVAMYIRKTSVTESLS